MACACVDRETSLMNVAHRDTHGAWLWISLRVRRMLYAALYVHYPTARLVSPPHQARCCKLRTCALNRCPKTEEADPSHIKQQCSAGAAMLGTTMGFQDYGFDTLAPG